MNTSGDAADQVMRMMLNGTEVLLKLSGAGAKQTAVLLYSALKQQSKTSGAARLSSMLRSGKPLKVYTFEDQDMERFQKYAKEYGVLFCILKDKDKTDGVFDVLVRAEDAAKLTRISERFNMGMVNATDLKADIIRENEEKKKTEEQTEPSTEKSDEKATEKSDEQSAEEQEETVSTNQTRDALIVDELMAQITEEQEQEPNPMTARTEVNPEASAESLPSTSKEGIPPELPTAAETERTEAPEKNIPEEAIPSVTATPEKSSPSEPISVSGRSTADRKEEKAEGKESVRAALERIRKNREKAVRDREKSKTKEPKGKESVR